MKRTKIAAWMIAAMVALSACSGGGGDTANKDGAKDNYEIKMGYYNCDHMIAGPVGEGAGIYKDHGLNVKLTGNGKVPDAMAAGQMDAGLIGVSGLYNAIPKGSPAIIAANNHTGGSYYLVASNDIKTKEDLIGKTVAFQEPSKNRNLHFGNNLGISMNDADYSYVNIGADADKYLALKQGQIQAYQTCDPWGSMAEYENTGHIIDSYHGMEGQPSICCSFVLNQNFIKDHEGLAVELLKAYEDANKYCYQHPVKTAQIFADYYKIPAEVALTTMYKKCVAEGRTLTWELNVDHLRNSYEGYKKYGFIDNPVEMEKIYTLDVYNKANMSSFEEFIKNEIDPIFPVGMTYEEFKAKAEEIDGPLGGA